MAMLPQNFLDQVPRDTISAIDDDLDTLEDLLEPLMAFPLEETLEKLSVIERAKLQTTIPYVVNDLIISQSTLGS
jgi:exosome complex protein LRP1